MDKKRILICDNKRVFFKMFKKKFNNEHEFSENTFLWEADDREKGFDSLILVVYNSMELLEFLKLYKKGVKVLVCIFNHTLFSNLMFLENNNDLILLDVSKKKSDIISDLKIYFNIDSDFNNVLHKNQLVSISLL